MTKLDTPDLCARLDRLKDLCDRLEDAQANPRRYRELVQQIRLETDAFRETICGVPESAHQ
jgi:hypothetical protein